MSDADPEGVENHSDLFFKPIEALLSEMVRMDLFWVLIVIWGKFFGFNNKDPFMRDFFVDCNAVDAMVASEYAFLRTM